MYTIGTLDQLARHLGIPLDVDDERLRQVLQSASGQLERLAGRHFCPRVETVAHDVDPRNPTELMLKDDLLQIQSVSNNGRTIPNADYVLLPHPPYSILQLKNGASFTYEGSPHHAVSITGTWGWHDDWPQAWRNSLDEVAVSLDATATTLTVGRADGTDEAGETPRLQTGQLIRVDSEYMRVVAITIDPDGADDLTVLRGVAGTQAAAHSLQTPIYTYQPPQDVVMLVLRWAAWLYKEPDNRAAEDAPQLLNEMLHTLRRVKV